MSGRTDWLSKAKWGLLMHFISDVCARDSGDPTMSPARWNTIVDGFDVENLTSQLHELEAGYFCLAIGQNSGYYCSPNAVYDGITGVRPPDLSKCSRRDLVADLHAALARHGIKLLVYLPSNAPCKDSDAIFSFEYTPPDEKFHKSWLEAATVRHYEEMAAGTNPRLVAFQHKWEAVIAEWSCRWGKSVSGWWIDGCYNANTRYRHADEPNFRSFAHSMRAGNPASVVAWNPGVLYPPVSMDEEEDYTAGEARPGDDLQKAMCLGKFERHALFHLLAPLGVDWAKGPSTRNADQLFKETASVTAFGGAVTWDIPFKPNGAIPEDIFAVLSPFSKKINATRGKPNKPSAMRPRSELKILRYPTVTPQGHAVDGAAELVLMNRHNSPIAGKMGFEARGPVSLEPSEVAYRLSPDESTKTSLLLKLPKAETGATALSLPNGMTALIPVRRQFLIPNEDVQVKLEDVKRKLGVAPGFQFNAADGNPYGELRVGAFMDKLAIWVRIEDHCPKRRSPYWCGSCVELFFARDDLSPISQLFCVAEMEGHEAAIYDLGENKLENVCCASSRDASGYEFCCVIPSSQALGGSDWATDPCLFESIATIPEEAGNVRATLFGSGMAFKDTANYCGLIKKPAIGEHLERNMR